MSDVEDDVDDVQDDAGDEDEDGINESVDQEGEEGEKGEEEDEEEVNLILSLKTCLELPHSLAFPVIFFKMGLFFQKDPDVPLTEEMIGDSLSLLCKTGDGLAHAFVRLEATEKLDFCIS